MEREHVDPVYAYIDERVGELRKDLLSTQRSIASLDVTMMYILILSAFRHDPQKYKELNKSVSSQARNILQKINKSSKPLDIASEFVDDLRKQL